MDSGTKCFMFGLMPQLGTYPSQPVTRLSGKSGGRILRYEVHHLCKWNGALEHVLPDSEGHEMCSEFLG